MAGPERVVVDLTNDSGVEYEAVVDLTLPIQHIPPISDDIGTMSLGFPLRVTAGPPFQEGCYLSNRPSCLYATLPVKLVESDEEVEEMNTSERLQPPRHQRSTPPVSHEGSAAPVSSQGSRSRTSVSCRICLETVEQVYCHAEDLVRDQKGVQITANTAEDEAENSDTGTHEQHISDHSTDVWQIVDRANKAIAISHCQTTLSRVPSSHKNKVLPEALELASDEMRSCGFHELLLQSSAEDSSETILCALDPLIEKLLSNEAQLREKNPEGGLAAAQLCSWVHGMMRWLRSKSYGDLAEYFEDENIDAEAVERLTKSADGGFAILRAICGIGVKANRLMKLMEDLKKQYCENAMSEKGKKKAKDDDGEQSEGEVADYGDENSIGTSYSHAFYHFETKENGSTRLHDSSESGSNDDVIRSVKKRRYLAKRDGEPPLPKPYVLPRNFTPGIMEGLEKKQLSQRQRSKFLAAIARDIFTTKNYPSREELHNVVVSIYASFPFFRTEKSDDFLAESLRCKLKAFRGEGKQRRGFREPKPAKAQNLKPLYPTSVMSFTPLVIDKDVEESERKSIQLMKMAMKKKPADTKTLENEMEKTFPIRRTYVMKNVYQTFALVQRYPLLQSYNWMVKEMKYIFNNPDVSWFTRWNTITKDVLEIGMSSFRRYEEWLWRKHCGEAPLPKGCEGGGGWKCKKWAMHILESPQIIEKCYTAFSAYYLKTINKQSPMLSEGEVERSTDYGDQGKHY
eukprot:Em0019g508a